MSCSLWSRGWREPARPGLATRLVPVRGMCPAVETEPAAYPLLSRSACWTFQSRDGRGERLVQDPLRASPVQTGIKIPVLSLSQAVGDKVMKAQCKPQSSFCPQQAGSAVNSLSHRQPVGTSLSLKALGSIVLRNSSQGEAALTLIVPYVC